MSNVTGGGRSFRTRFRPSIVMARGGRTLLFGIGVILILAGGVGGFIWGRQLTYNDVLAGRDLVQQVQSENQTYNRQIIELSTRVTALQSKLAQVQSTLSAIMPADNTYSINPNQSMVVADGRLTIGLIGSPTNEGVNINVDGKQQMVAAGDVIKVAPDPSTNCKVTVQSFDLFKAVVSASCTATKAKAQ